MKFSNFVLGILAVIIGVLLCVMQGEVLSYIITALGVILIVNGIMMIVKANLIGGLVACGVGVVVILGGWLFLSVCVIILGVALILMGVYQFIKNSAAAKHLKGAKAFFGFFLYPIIEILLGIAFLFMFGTLMDIFTIICGVLLILYGISLMLGKSKA
ncbi:MAG: DUF308 domain-containing protein [Clostridia bacterium]|nr:DUF308 domain-containing protein [Clostridia bacterium]